MKTILIAAIAALSITPALAEGPCTDFRPPANLTGNPSRPFHLEILSDADMAATCGYSDDGMINVYACEIEPKAKGDDAVIYIDENQDVDDRACLYNHEIAHVNGWPEDHPAVWPPLSAASN